MRWAQNQKYIEDENSQIVCILPDGADIETVQIILKAPKMLEAIHEFISEADNGSLPARRMYNTFKTIIEDIVPAA